MGKRDYWLKSKLSTGSATETLMSNHMGGMCVGQKCME